MIICFDKKFRNQLDDMAKSLGVDSVTLSRYMIQFCMRWNLDQTGLELKSDFVDFVNRSRDMDLFCIQCSK